MKTLAGIIHARAKMIMEQVDYEIKLSGYHKKLIAGVVLTGGGAQLKNIKELCELMTTTDTRIGIPNEHLDPESVSYADLAHPMYATGIGLVLYGLEKTENPHQETEEEDVQDNGRIDIFADMNAETTVEAEPKPEEKSKEKKGKGRGFDKILGSFLDNMFKETIDE